MISSTLYRSCLLLSKRIGEGASTDILTRSYNLSKNQKCICKRLLTQKTMLISQKFTRNYIKPTDENRNNELEQLKSDMNIRLANENGFLSWCRNAYLSTVVGVAMIAEGTTELALDAGFSALLIAFMNMFWGTGNYITNLIRLRHANGMSSFTLFLSIMGSLLHALIWLFVLLCYIGFLDETSGGHPPSLITSRKNKENKKV